MIYIYQRTYASNMIRIILVIISGISLFAISKQGWEKTSNVLINIFIVTSLTSLFFTQWTFVFKENENLETNRNLYIRYINLYNQLLSYPSTGTTGTILISEDPKKVITPSLFIATIDSEMAKLNQVPLDWDSNRILKTEDVSKTLTTNPVTPTNSPESKSSPTKSP